MGLFDKAKQSVQGQEQYNQQVKSTLTPSPVVPKAPVVPAVTPGSKKEKEEQRKAIVKNSWLENYNLSLPGIGRAYAQANPQIAQNAVDETNTFINEKLDNPMERFAFGAFDKINPAGSALNNLERTVGDIDTEKLDKSIAYQAGNMAGYMGQYALSGGLGIESAVFNGMKALPRVAGMGKIASPLLRGVTSNAVGGLPINVTTSLDESVQDGKVDGGQFAKSMAINTAIDTVLGGAVEGISALARLRRYSKAKQDEVIEKVAKEVGMTDLEKKAFESNVRKGKITPDGDTLYGNASQPIAGELPAPVDAPVKTSNATTKPLAKKTDTDFYTSPGGQTAKDPKTADIKQLPQPKAEIQGRNGVIGYVDKQGVDKVKAKSEAYRAIKEAVGAKDTQSNQVLMDVMKAIDTNVKDGWDTKEFWDGIIEAVKKQEYEKVDPEKLYPGLKKEIRETPIRITGDLKQITDFNDLRKKSMGKVKLSKNGKPMDELYMELSEMHPDLFPSSITHPTEQLETLIKVSDSLNPTVKTMGDVMSDDDLWDGPLTKVWKAINDYRRTVKEDISYGKAKGQREVPTTAVKGELSGNVKPRKLPTEAKPKKELPKRLPKKEADIYAGAKGQKEVPRTVVPSEMAGNTPKSAVQPPKTESRPIAPKTESKEVKADVQSRANDNRSQAKPDTRTEKILEQLDKKSRDSGVKAEGKLYEVSDHPYRSRVESIAKRFGADVVFVKPLVDEADYFNGINLDGVIIISDKAQSPINVVLGHEVMHQLQRNNPAEFDKFAKLFKNELNSGKYSKYAEMMENIGKDANIKYKEDDILEEMMADFSGEMFNDPSIMKSIFAEDRNLAQKIYDIITEMIEKLKGTIQETYIVSDGIKNLKKVQDEYVQLMKKQVRLEKNGIDVTNGSAYFDTAKFSLKTWMETDKKQLVEDLTEIIGDRKKVAKYIESIEGVARTIESNPKLLDYESSDIFDAVKANSDSLYVFSLDFSTLCRKRYHLQATTEAIAKRNKTFLTGDQILQVRDALEKSGYEVSCLPCYVESQRLKFGKFSKRFTEDMIAYTEDLFRKKSYKMNDLEMAEFNRLTEGKALKEIPKKQADLARKFKKQSQMNYKFSPEEQKVLSDLKKNYNEIKELLLSTDGIAVVKSKYPEVHEAFTTMVRNATRGKALEARVSYKSGDLKKKLTKGQIDALNANAGMRWFSWSDFETHHLIDMMQSVSDMSVLKLKSHLYTKVEDTVHAMAKTNIMMNTSLIPKRGGLLNGKLDFDPKEGMDFAKTLELREKYPDTVGNIAIGVTDEQIRAMMKSADIDYIIPYHASGLPVAVRRKFDAGMWKSYQNSQEEKVIDKLLNKRKGGKKSFAVSEWWDFKSTNKDDIIRNSTENYLRLCKENGLSPKFPEFVKDEGYWKLLIDRKMINQITGQTIVQKPVIPEFDDAVLDGILKKQIESGKTAKISDYAVDEIVKEFDGKFSLKRDSDGKALTKEQEAFYKNSKIRDEDGNLLKVYHGTEAEFTVFDRSKGRANMDIQGSFFSPWELDSKGYGKNVKPYYLNITNPASESEAYKALNRFKGQDYAGKKATEYLMSKGYDGVRGDDELIAFYPEQIKSVDNLNPTPDPDIRFSLKRDSDGNYGYHAGDLGKAEHFGRQEGSNRGTGHFGTGTYFVGNKTELDLGGYKDRPQHTVDFNDYNLYKPYNKREAERTHDMLSYINKYRKVNWKASVPFEEWYPEIRKAEEYSYEIEGAKSVDAIAKMEDLISKSRLVDKYKINDIKGRYLGWENPKALDEIGDTKVWQMYEEIKGVFDEIKDDVQDIWRRRMDAVADAYPFIKSIDEKAFDKVIDEINSQIGKIDKGSLDKSDSASTIFMKRFGYEGVDVRHIKEFDNTKYGSVIYDLKPSGEETKFSMKRGMESGLHRERVKKELQDSPEYQEIIKELEDVILNDDPIIEHIAKRIKDHSGLTMDLKDVYRNMRDAFGKDFDIIKEKYLDPFDASKKQYVDTMKKYTDIVYKEVTKDLKIRKGSKESSAVQWIGEGKRQMGWEWKIDDATGKKYKTIKLVDYSLDDLKKDFPNRWQDIKKASEKMRELYDDLIDEVNESRRKIYPNSPEKLVPKRKDYFRHYREMSSSFQGLWNVFASSTNIDPKLAGISEFTQPKSKWASYMQQRGMGKYKEDAIGGFLDYIGPASYSINIDPHINQFRNLAKQIAEATVDTKNANNTIAFLHDFANSLAGKTVDWDRLFVKKVGRKPLIALSMLNNRVKKNQILMNFRSALSQVANVPLGIAKIKNPVSLTKGVGDAITSIAGLNPKVQGLYNRSQFISERYSRNLLDRFDNRWIDQPEKLAGWLLEGADQLGTKFIWNSAYHNAVDKGIANPIKYADDLTRALVAGRGIGEVPLLQQSKVFQMIAPFQLEVTNLWHVFGDMRKEKDFGGILLILLGNYLFNNAYEEAVGDRVVFDPIDAVAQSIKDGNTASQTGARLAGEMLSNIPLGQTFASVYPEYGMEITIPGTEKKVVDLPSRKELFGDNDPTRYGSGILLTKAVQDPLYRLLPPMGGSQVKKTVEAVSSLKKGEVSKDGKINYLVEKKPENMVKGALFGKYAFDEAKTYTERDRRPLTEKQSEAVRTSKDPEKAYEKTMIDRRMNTLNDKIKDVKKDDALTEAEQKKEIVKILKEQIAEVKGTTLYTEEEKRKKVLDLQGKILKYQK